jgi:hypothetical protein
MQRHICGFYAAPPGLFADEANNNPETSTELAMSDTRTSSRTAFWATVLLATVVLYVASFGPACWISSHFEVGASLIPKTYRPMTWAMSRSETAFEALNWYAQFGAASGWQWVDLYRLFNPATGKRGESPDWIWVKMRAN